MGNCCGCPPVNQSPSTTGNISSGAFVQNSPLQMKDLAILKVEASRAPHSIAHCQNFGDRCWTYGNGHYSLRGRSQRWWAAICVKQPVMHKIQNSSEIFCI